MKTTPEPRDPEPGCAMSRQPSFRRSISPPATVVLHSHGDGGFWFPSRSGVLGLLTFGLGLVQASLTAQSPVPDGFDPRVSRWGGYAWVNSLAVQTDGKVVIGGDFTHVGGYTMDNARDKLARVNADGTLDAKFNPGADGEVSSLLVQTDGKILVGGNFTRLGGQPHVGIGRLHADGTPDAGFTLGADNIASTLTAQADGKVLVGGWFTTLGGQPRSRIARLNANGSLDLAFRPSANSDVYALALQANGQILVGGGLGSLNGQGRSRIGRLNSDGSLDTGFNPGADGWVNTLAVQADGKILVGGYFTTLGGQPRNRIGRLNVDGTVDGGFNPAVEGGDPPHVDSIVLQADGRILVGGAFTSLGGLPRAGIARLHADGTLDDGFNPGTGGDFPSVASLAVQADGKILVGGGFSRLGGQFRAALGRLNNTESPTQSLAFDGSSIVWLRGSTSPEVRHTSFEHASDGVTWIRLGAGSRIPGGWELTGLSLPAESTIRARGHVAGSYEGSGWFVDTITGPPGISFHPAPATNTARTSVSFSVAAGGSEPLSFRWHKDGVALADGAMVHGSTTPMLTVSNVFKPDEGSYSVVVSNAYGSATSSPARLWVIDPFITGQPVGQNREPGQSVTFTVTNVGSVPFNYQWRRDGVALPESDAASLTLTNVQATDAGDYTVVVNNRFGSMTSAVAELSVNLALLDGQFSPGANDDVRSLAMQPDGKILMGGDFTSVDGQARHRMARLRTDGNLDTDFAPSAVGELFGRYVPRVDSLAIQPDARILVGGYFTNLVGQPRQCLGRLNADGTLDNGFNPWTNGWVSVLALQADGKILVGGVFARILGQPRTNIARLNPDGTLDSGFNPGATRSDNVVPSVSSLAVQADGKILVGGNFTTLGGQPRNFIGRLNANGTVDAGFNPGADYDNSVSLPATVSALAVQADGKILVGGFFTTLGGQPRSYIGRLNNNGTLDSEFNPDANSPVWSVALQADGKILAGGGFTSLAGQPRSGLARLNADGTLDHWFSPSPNDLVFSLAVQADGKILVGGAFSTMAGQPRTNMARLNNTDPATESLIYDGSALTWRRGGASPEVWRTTFEHSTNGSAWTSLGAGSRIVGGWKRTTRSLPAGTVRARGYVSGSHESSGWFVERRLEITPPPVMVVQDGPGGFTNQPVGFNVQGGTGLNVAIDASTNFVDWFSLETNTLGANPLYFTDPGSTNFPWRFYRARLVP